MIIKTMIQKGKSYILLPYKCKETRQKIYHVLYLWPGHYMVSIVDPNFHSARASHQKTKTINK